MEVFDANDPIAASDPSGQFVQDIIALTGDPIVMLGFRIPRQYSRLPVGSGQRLCLLLVFWDWTRHPAFLL